LERKGEDREFPMLAYGETPKTIQDPKAIKLKKLSGSQIREKKGEAASFGDREWRESSVGKGDGVPRQGKLIIGCSLGKKNKEKDHAWRSSRKRRTHKKPRPRGAKKNIGKGEGEKI